VLGRALKLAKQMGMKIDVPWINKLPEDNARKVFVDSELEVKIKKAAAELGLWQRVFVEMGFLYGWRKGELLSLTVSDVALTDRSIRLRTSKNGEPREVPITEGLLVLLLPLITGRTDRTARLFPTDDFRSEWATICAKAGVASGKAGITFHDLRRTSARNKRNDGMPVQGIMELQGWKTEAMFRRYAITDIADKRKWLEMSQNPSKEGVSLPGGQA